MRPLPDALAVCQKALLEATFVCFSGSVRMYIDNADLDPQWVSQNALFVRLPTRNYAKIPFSK